MKRAVLAALPLLAVLAAGCGSSITSGTVTSKQDVPAHNETVWIPQYRTQCTTQEEEVGSQMEPEQVCSQVYTYSLPVQQYVPEDWRLHITNGQESGWVDVSQSVYNDVRDGSHWQATS